MKRRKRDRLVSSDEKENNTRKFKLDYGSTTGGSTTCPNRTSFVRARSRKTDHELELPRLSTAVQDDTTLQFTASERASRKSTGKRNPAGQRSVVLSSMSSRISRLW